MTLEMQLQKATFEAFPFISILETRFNQSDLFNKAHFALLNSTLELTTYTIYYFYNYNIELKHIVSKSLISFTFCPKLAESVKLRIIQSRLSPRHIYIHC